MLKRSGRPKILSRQFIENNYLTEIRCSSADQMFKTTALNLVILWWKHSQSACCLWSASPIWSLLQNSMTYILQIMVLLWAAVYALWCSSLVPDHNMFAFFHFWLKTMSVIPNWRPQNNTLLLTTPIAGCMFYYTVHQLLVTWSSSPHTSIDKDRKWQVTTSAFSATVSIKN